MAYVITDECVSCGTCAGECPVEAIAEGDSHYEINPMYALSAEHAQAYVQPRLSQKSNLYGMYKRKSFADFFFIHTFQNFTEKPSSSQSILLPLHFHVPAEMLQRPGEGFLSAVLGKNVADLVEFLRFAAGLVQNELIVGICPVLIEGIAAGKILVQRFCGADDIKTSRVEKRKVRTRSTFFPRMLQALFRFLCAAFAISCALFFTSQSLWNRSMMSSGAGILYRFRSVRIVAGWSKFGEAGVEPCDPTLVIMRTMLSGATGTASTMSGALSTLKPNCWLVSIIS